MKIPAAKVQNFIKSPDKGINFILVYGPDSGMVSEHSKTICKTVLDDLSDPFRVTEISLDTIKNEPANFAAELNAISMMGGRRLIRVQANSTTLPKEITKIIDDSSSDTMVVISAGDLTPASTLRKYFEQSSKAAAVPCYKDDGASLQRIVSGKLSENGYNFNSDVVRYLSDSFSGDRMVVLSEVDKLMIYMNDNKQITLDDVQTCIFDSSEFSLDELCSAFASREPYATEKHLTRAFNESVMPIVIIRSILRYFMRLQTVKTELAKGANEQQAMASLRPPVFFKQVPVFKKHLAMWKDRDISKVISRFNELEADCKTTGNPAELLCARMLLILPLTVR